MSKTSKEKDIQPKKAVTFGIFQCLLGFGVLEYFDCGFGNVDCGILLGIGSDKNYQSEIYNPKSEIH